MNASRVISSVPHVLSRWVTLQERTVLGATASEPQTFHSLSQLDYVTILTITNNNRVLLVRQFRPALQDFSLELPGGLVEIGELPAVSAERELLEETGFRPLSPLVELGCLCPDSGRLENRLWAFFSSDIAPVPHWQPESDVEALSMDIQDFKDSVCNGSFDNALHISILALAMLRNLV